MVPEQGIEPEDLGDDFLGAADLGVGLKRGFDEAPVWGRRHGAGVAEKRIDVEMAGLADGRFCERVQPGVTAIGDQDGTPVAAVDDREHVGVVERVQAGEIEEFEGADVMPRAFKMDFQAHRGVPRSTASLGPLNRQRNSRMVPHTLATSASLTEKADGSHTALGIISVATGKRSSGRR